jgi:RNA polymerase sigma-70 factor (ECF subfamily)
VALPKQATQSGAGPTDAALVLAARTGESWAQEALYRRYARMANSLAYRILANQADADDLVQDAFTTALSTLQRLENAQAFGSWLGSIVVRTAHKRLRRARLMERLGLRRSEPIDLDELISEDVAPDIVAEARALYRAVESLKADERVALILHRVEGMTSADVARHMGVSLATVKRKISSALAKLAHMKAEDEVSRDA